MSSSCSSGICLSASDPDAAEAPRTAAGASRPAKAGTQAATYRRNIGVFMGPILLAWLIGHEPYALDLGWTDAARVIAAITAVAVLVAIALGQSLRHRAVH